MSNPYDYQAPRTRHATFKPHGYGPFTVRRTALVEDIVSKATPERSVHISGCRGAGKTIMLHEIAQKLAQNEKRVFFFKSAKLFDNADVVKMVQSLIEKGEEAYVVVDETQTNHDAALFVDLLKNVESHKVTTIGAGISENISTSHQFFYRYMAADLFLKTNQDLVDEGVVEYFAPEQFDDHTKAQIKLLLQHIRHYVGGHVYPLMWLAEKLVPELIPNQEQTGVRAKAAAGVVALLESPEFQREEEFQFMIDRIMPTEKADIRCLFYNREDGTALALLRRKGVLSQDDKVLSYLLLASIVSRTSPKVSIGALKDTLSAGVSGVSQLLCFALPHLDWSMYKSFGGPTEDALTHELMVTLNRVPTLTAKLFNPKLVDAGTSGRRPDMFFNSSVNSFVEAVLASSTNATTVLDIERHMRRFLGPNPRYDIGNKEYAILVYQEQEQQPIPLQYLNDAKEGPMTAQMRADMQAAYRERVFTFVMQSGAVYLGNMVIVAASR